METKSNMNSILYWILALAGMTVTRYTGYLREPTFCHPRRGSVSEKLIQILLWRMTKKETK
jgi:hypothetical protein